MQFINNKEGVMEQCVSMVHLYHPGDKTTYAGDETTDCIPEFWSILNE